MNHPTPRIHFAALTVALAMTLLAGCAPKPPPAPPPATAPVPDPAAWRSLFNGADLAGWKPIGTAVWRVDQSGPWPAMILGTQDGDPKRWGLLTTLDQFQNFELELEFMIDEHGKYNSGVYLRNTPGTGDRTGYQVNIGRGAAGEYSGGVFTDHWLAKGDEADAIRKPLDWNLLRIRADGPHLTVHLNRQQVVDFTDPAPTPILLQKGVIGLQTYGAEGHAGWVKFRNLRIRELPPTPKFD